MYSSKSFAIGKYLQRKKEESHMEANITYKLVNH